MRQKIGLFVLALLAVVSLFFLLPWYKESRRRDEAARRALGEIRQEIAETSALAALGDINIDPADVTLKSLNDVLQRSPHEISDHPKNSKFIRMGWACGGDLCTVTAFFLKPPGGQVPLSAPPVELWIGSASFGKPFAGSIGGIHLGDSPEKVIDICRQRGYQPRTRVQRISWDKDWEIAWTEMDGKVSSLVFFNMTLLNRAAAELKAGA